jgi:hypothetical protein
MNETEENKLPYIKFASANVNAHFITIFFLLHCVCRRFVKHLSKISQQFDAAW